jgi:hypothetical protein
MVLSSWMSESHGLEKKGRMKDGRDREIRRGLKKNSKILPARGTCLDGYDKWKFDNI